MCVGGELQFAHFISPFPQREMSRACRGTEGFNTKDCFSAHWRIAMTSVDLIILYKVALFKGDPELVEGEGFKNKKLSLPFVKGRCGECREGF